jgi:hypothetical protein
VKPTEKAALEISGLERHLGDYTPGRFAWLFDRERLLVLPEPVVCRGALGLWDVPTDVVETIARDVALADIADYIDTFYKSHPSAQLP